MKMTAMRGILAALVLAGTLLLPAVQVRAEAREVATMIDTKGDVTFMNAGGSWYAAYPEMRNRLLDRVKTGNESVATLEFDIGGRVGVNKNSEIEIVGERAVESTSQGVVQKIVLQAGGIWAKISGQRTELQVQTSGGVMGIKGTEFVVETTPEGQTTLSVFEGEVEVRPAAGGPPVAATAGTKVTFDPKTVPVVKKYDQPQDLRNEIMQGWQLFEQVAGPLLSAVGASGAMGQASSYVGQSIAVVSDPAQAAKDFAASQVSSRAPGPFGGLIGGAISNAGNGGDKKPDFPVGLTPDQTSVDGPPTFRWDPVDNAKGYVVLVSQKEDMATVSWQGRVAETAAVYPQNGRPLEAARYYWRLIAVDGEGKPIGKASQTYFDSNGWSPAAQ